MDAEGFDVLTWRKGFVENVDPDLFTDVTYVDETGRAHAWRVADTTVDLPVGEHDEVFTMRQVTLLVANNKTSRAEHGQDSTRQIHIAATRTDLPIEQVIYRMGSRWRQENYFRYARMHFDLDSHDAYATTDDDPTRLVPNPAKKKAHQQVLAARARYELALAATDAGPGRDRRGPAGRSIPATRPDGTDHQRRGRQADCRPPRSRVQPGQRPSHPPGHPHPATAGPGQPRPAGPGRSDQADQPCHPHRRVQQRHRPGPRRPRPHWVRPREPRSPRSGPSSLTPAVATSTPATAP